MNDEAFKSMAAVTEWLIGRSGDGADVRPLGRHRLKGVDRAVEVFGPSADCVR